MVRHFCLIWSAVHVSFSIALMQHARGDIYVSLHVIVGIVSFLHDSIPVVQSFGSESNSKTTQDVHACATDLHTPCFRLGLNSVL